MRLTKRLLQLVAALIVLVVLNRTLRQEQPPAPASGPSESGTLATPPFDYYLIALSWSPSFCESNPQEREQCGKRGFELILHGLWPQLDGGRGPVDCDGYQHPQAATIERSLAFMPSRRLIDHEWRTHGTCSGLDPESYFALADRAFASIAIPPALQATARPGPMTAEDIRQAFINANPAFDAGMIGVSCKSGKFSEVRICVDRDLQPRECGKGVGMQCPRDVPLRIPLVR